jgi:hypothetical protein
MEVPGSISGRVLGNFSSDLFLLSAFSSPVVHSASNRNEYQGISLGVKYAVAWSWQLCRPSCAECQSKGGSSSFHPPSETAWLVMGKLYLFHYVILLKIYSFCVARMFITVFTTAFNRNYTISPSLFVSSKTSVRFRFSDKNLECICEPLVPPISSSLVWSP